MVSIFLFQKQLINTILNTLSGPFSVLLVVIYIVQYIIYTQRSILGTIRNKNWRHFLPNHLAEGFLLMAWKLSKPNFQILFSFPEEKRQTNNSERCFLYILIQTSWGSFPFGNFCHPLLSHQTAFQFERRLKDIF